MVELAMSSETIERLSQVAQQRGDTVQDLAEQIIRQFLREEAERKMQQEADAFRAMHPELLTTYLDQYVAIYQSQVIDHDPDQLTLFLRIDHHYPHEVVLIRQVRPEVETVYTMRSPRFEHE